LLALAAPVTAPVFAQTIASAVADPSRPAADKAVDPERKPAELLAFAGVKPGMVVVDLIPGGGYFTRLFSSAVGPKGRVIAYVPDEMLARSDRALTGIKAVAAEPGRANVTVQHNPMMAPVPDNVADIVWTSQNYHDFHNMPGVDVIGFNKLIFKLLRPGGTYVVVDHAAAPGSGTTHTADLHRIDPATARSEIEAAGFVFAGESDVLANPADPHTSKVFDPSIRGHTDKFVYRFRKPGGAR
jgi:predicted methyltransferase